MQTVDIRYRFVTELLLTHLHSIKEFVLVINIASCAIGMRSMVSYIKRGMQAKGILKQHPEY